MDDLIRRYRLVCHDLGEPVSRGELEQIAALCEADLLDLVERKEARLAEVEAANAARRQKEEAIPPTLADPTLTTGHDAGGGRRLMKKGDPFGG